MVNKSLLSVAISLLAAAASANPVATSSADDTVPANAILTPSPVASIEVPELGIPKEGLALPDLVIYPPGYNKTAAEEGGVEARGYAETCNSCILFNTDPDLVLQCYCGKSSGGSNHLRFNLNQCIGNSNG
ncbi:hypothetical protein CPLU01_09343 [Colletotrichum plurivorum]|uniref:Cyanovirin-N domain-containing protein n=1 Tax=Colletotrichum plurivorum TaxID=2175906 RepID=A0A8H6NB76_9PEZI|nr:hypothetical protein CPLU01_09343 [Colletotrichum plurivorum]